jgi:hemerythrin-like domain-containing protein
MQARGALMMEHRVIERMIALMEGALTQIDTLGMIDLLFVDAVVDFVRTYADRTHHGKEEDILFRDLGKKTLSVEDRRLMNELIADHVLGRNTTRALADAGARYCGGDSSALADIAKALKALVELYPRHIEKEDRIFFPGSRAYLTDEEDQAMLGEFREFDSRMIHEKYKGVVERLGG